MVRERAEIELISLLTQPDVITNFSSEPAVLREGVRRLGVRGRQHGAQLMEAIQDATKGVVAEGRRPVILVLRVGVEGTTPLVGSEVRERLRRSGALLYVVSTASAQRQPPTSARQGPPQPRRCARGRRAGVGRQARRDRIDDEREPGPVAPGAITGGVDEREVLPSHDCEVCKLGQPLKSGSAIVLSDWATRRSPSWDSKVEKWAETEESYEPHRVEQDRTHR